ncbi:MAG TPA: porin family protein [Thermoanaerobaculia bacterium]|nr:porin family protein [Thermoanaerobaculia bacterium]
MRTQPRWVIAALLGTGLVLTGASTPVWAQGYLGISAGLYQPEGDEADRTEVFGIRGGYRFHPSFGVEGSLSRVDLADAFPLTDLPAIPELDVDLQADLYNLDVSLQWLPGRGNLLVFAGPGIARLDAEIDVTFFGQRISESESSDIFTAHAGLAYEWEVSDRAFVRTDARVRRYFDDDLEDQDTVDTFAVSYKATDYEASVIFGWRLGS